MKGACSRMLFVAVCLTGLGLTGYIQMTGVRSQAGQAIEDLPAVGHFTQETSAVVCAPGVTEPASRTVQIFSEIPGTIRRIFVSSGDRVARGDPLFELANDTQAAEVRHREALVKTARASLAKLESWDRPEDRTIAKARWDEAEAMARIAEFEVSRLQSLARSDAASDKEVATCRDHLAAARARAQAAKAQYDRTVAGPSPEDLEVARAAVQEAEAALAVSQTLLDKTVIRSPLDGMVIYRFREPGETVIPEVPSPILSIGDCSTLHLRADVDEADLAKVAVGQRVFATAEAFGDRRFEGTVIHVEKTLGRKNFRTNRPNERADTKVLEVVIALDEAEGLPVDLQMTVWFQSLR